MKYLYCCCCHYMKHSNFIRKKNNINKIRINRVKERDARCKNSQCQCFCKYSVKIIRTRTMLTFCQLTVIRVMHFCWLSHSCVYIYSLSHCQLVWFHRLCIVNNHTKNLLDILHETFSSGLRPSIYWCVHNNCFGICATVRKRSSTENCR